MFMRSKKMRQIRSNKAERRSTFHSLWHAMLMDTWPNKGQHDSGHDSDNKGPTLQSSLVQLSPPQIAGFSAF